MRRGMLIFTLLSSSLGAIDNAHFYNTPRYHGWLSQGAWDGSKLTETAPWLTKGAVQSYHGSATRSYDNKGNKTTLLGLYGPQEMLHLTAGAPRRPDYLNVYEQLGAALSPAMTQDTFGTLNFDGKFSIDEVHIDLRQNYLLGFFSELHMPIRHLRLSGICYEDLSAKDGLYSQQNGTWKRLLSGLDHILQNHGYAPLHTPFSTTSIGDVSFLIGFEQWVKALRDPDVAVRFLVKLGLLLPTGTRDDRNMIFSLPTGYNDHWGIPLHAEVEGCLQPYVRVGARVGVITFFEKTMKRRMKTHPMQQGIVKLEKGRADVEKGTLWYVGCEAIADYHGFSFLLGYSFNRREQNEIIPLSKTYKIDGNSVYPTDKFDPHIVNNDSVLFPWYLHVLHLGVSFDYSVHEPLRSSRFAPHVGLFYNLTLSGRNAFDVNMFGGGLSLDMRWVF